MDLPLLQRLRGIHQTSLAYLTFPTALHTRFDHSLGVCSGTKHLVSQVLGLLRSDPLHMELSAAALLHDIGHGPFSHLSEDAYALRPDLFANLIYTASEDEDQEAPYPEGKPHEVIGALLLTTRAAKRFFDRMNDHYGTGLDPERIGNIITGNGTGSPFEDPVDMLRFADADFTKWTVSLPDEELVSDGRLRHLLRLLARRELPVRVREISPRSLEGPCLEEMFRYRDPTHSDAGLVYEELLELRSAIARQVREATEDSTLYEDEIWIDLPRSPQLGDGTLIDNSRRLRNLSDVFPTRQWVEYYKQHRYVGYIFGPRRHRAAVDAATTRVLGERGIEFVEAPTAS